MHIGTVYKVNSKGERKAYYRLEESYRNSCGQPRTRRFCVLGYLEELPILKQHMLLLSCIEQLAYHGQRPMSGDETVDRLTYEFYEKMVRNGRLAEVKEAMREYREELARKGFEKVNLSMMKNTDAREIGAEHVCLETLRRLGVDKFLAGKGWTPAEISLAMMQIASRAIYPVSELRTVKYMRENSALCELLGIDPMSFNHRHLHKSANRLYELHTELEDWLHNRVCTLFDIKDEILLFDLTNTYFEGRMERSELAKYGRSKEKRRDCKLVVLAAIVNTEGLLVRTRILEGNASDCSTMKSVMDSLAREQLRFGKENKDITVVMDAGISTEENIRYLEENGNKYITVTRSSTVKCTSMGMPTKEVTDNKGQIIRLERVAVGEDRTHYLLVDSKAKTLKERSMYKRACQEYEEGLKVIADGIIKRGGTKKLEKVYERLGRLKGHCSAVNRGYEVQVLHDDKNIVTAFTWRKLPEKSLGSETKHGKYVLRTNMDIEDEVNVWEFYNVIRVVESTFRCLKTDLELRPVYHKGDQGTKSHLHLAVLAYWIVSTVQYQLKRHDVHTEWKEVIRILNTHKIVSTEVSREEKGEVKIRQCTEPGESVRALYQFLNIQEIPLKKRKFVVHPEENLKKTDIENQENGSG